MGEVSIRRALMDDAATIAEYNRRMADETEDLKLDHAVLLPGVVAAISDATPAAYYVAEADGLIVGQVMVTYEWSDWRNGCIWWLQSVYVHPEWRRHGIFRQLFEHVRSVGREAGAIGLRLYVEKGNTAAQKSYSRMGMQPSPYVVWELLEGEEIGG